MKIWGFRFETVICFLITVSTFEPVFGQNVNKLCQQVYKDCQACSVFQSECNKHPSQRPQHPPPETVTTSTPATSTTHLPPPKCLADGKGCSSSEECCFHNCKVESIAVNGNSYTIKVCRSMKPSYGGWK